MLAFLLLRFGSVSNENEDRRWQTNHTVSDNPDPSRSLLNNNNEPKENGNFK